MGFHIPDSPQRSSVCSSESQTTTTTSTATTTSTTTSTDTDGGDTTQFSERFSMRRRNALVPDLFIDVVGSPRSPYVCLSRDHRLALSQQRDFGQQTIELDDAALDRETNREPEYSSTFDADVQGDEAAKRAPGIRRRAHQHDVATEASFEPRASVNAHDTP